MSTPIMLYDRQHAQLIEEKVMSRQMVDFLYTHPVGRLIENHLLARPFVSKLGGYLKAKQGKASIAEFIKAYDIDTHEIAEPVENYATFGAFFVRKLKAEARPFDKDPLRLVSPADARLLCFPIESNGRYIPVKGRDYSLFELLENRSLSQQFAGGWIFIYRLAPVDYHRYCYIDDGEQSDHVQLKGRLHSVNPVAIDTQMPIFARNYREYSLLKTRHFGTVLQMEVGALIVGKIVQHHMKRHIFERAEEKGLFEFGGSTIIQLFMPQCIKPDTDLIKQSQQGIETLVKYGMGTGWSTL